MTDKPTLQVTNPYPHPVIFGVSVSGPIDRALLNYGRLDAHATVDLPNVAALMDTIAKPTEGGGKYLSITYTFYRDEKPPLDEAVVLMRRELASAQAIFLQYYNLHMAKEPPDIAKAMRNLHHAHSIGRLLLLTHTAGLVPPEKCPVDDDN